MDITIYQALQRAGSVPAYYAVQIGTQKHTATNRARLTRWLQAQGYTVHYEPMPVQRHASTFWDITRG